MKKKVFLIPLALFMTAGTVMVAGCGEKKPDPVVVQTLDSISVTKLPTKLEYNAGDTFDPTGLEVTAKYSDGSTKVLAGTDYTLSPTQSLPAGTTKVTVSYEEGGVSKTAEIGVTVHEAPVEKVLKDIIVDIDPNKTDYLEHEDFDPEGMEVFAIYSDDSRKEIFGTEYTIDPLHDLAEGTDHVTVSYTEGDVTKTATVAITVTKGEFVPVERVKYALNPQAYTIEIGEEIGITIEIEPENATNKNVTYEFSNPGIVSIEDGKIKGLSDGQTDITIASVSNPDVKTTIKGFTVTKVAGEFPEETANGLSLLETNNLESGDTINIAGVIGDKYYGMGPTGGNYIQAVELEISDEKLVTGDNFAYTVFKNNDGTFLLRDKNGKFVTAPGGGNNAGGADGYVDAAKFNISISDDGVASIVGADEGIEQRFLSLNPNNGSPRFSCYKAATASNYAKYVIYQKDNEEEPKSVDSVAFLKESYEVDVGSTIEVTAKVSPLDAANQEITYSLAEMSEEGVASISGSKVSGLKEGTAKIVATSVDGSKVAEVALTINAEAMPEHAGTLDDPYTAADAVIVANKLASGKYTSESYYIKGVVTSLIDSFDPTYGNYSFWLDEVFEGYRLLNGSGKAKFNDGDIEVGDTVTVYSQIQNYNGIAENKNGYVYSVEKPAVPATGVTLDNSELTMEVGSIPQQLNATVAPEGASQEVIWSSSDESKVTVVDGLVTAVAVTEEETPVIITAKVASNESLTATCAVTVTPKTRTMTGITATGLAKTEYTEGELLDLTGLVVEAVYDDKSTEPIASGYTTNIALDHPLELTDTSLVISYNKFDADAITLTINEFTPIVADGTYLLASYVQAKAEDPLETYYFKNVGGDKPAGATALIADATPVLIENVTGKQNVVTLKIGDKYLKGTATNNGLVFDTKPFEFTVVETELGLGSFELRFVDSNSKTRGITIYKGSDGYVDLRCYEITSGSYKSGVGTVEPVVVDSISVTTQPTKTEYFVGDTFDPTGMVVEATLVGGIKSVVTTYTYSTEAFDTEGAQNVTISFAGKETTVAVNVAQKRTMTAIKIAGSLNVTEYGVGETYSLAGLKVQAVYDVGDPEDLDSSAYSLSLPEGKEIAALGDTSITVTAHLLDETLEIADATKTCDVVVAVKSSIINDKKTGKTFVSTDPNTLTIDGIEMNTSGVKTGSGDAQDKNYGYFMMNKGYIASTSAKEGYYIAKVVVTYTSGTAVKGKVAIGLTAESNSALLTDGTTPEKSGTLVLTNDDQTKRYFNISETSGNNTQVASIVVYWAPIAA